MHSTIQTQIPAILRRLAAWLLVLVLLLGCMPAMPARAASDGTVKVKLTRLGTPSTIKLTTTCAYVLSGDVKMNIPSGSSVTISASGGKMTLSTGGVKVHCGSGLKLLRCGSGANGIRFSSPALSNVFCGDLYLSASGSAITAILHIYIEDYLYGVVAYEMSDSYPLEALKAQAVAARNYVMQKMSASRNYHVTDSTSDQVFKGYNSGYARVIQAVNETAGQALYAGGSLASCYYTASNGGQTESTKNAWGGSLSYSTVKDDPYDLENASAKKTTATIKKDASGLHASLKAALLEGSRSALEALGADFDTAELVSIDSIAAINPKYASPSRLYKTLRFVVKAEAKHAQSGQTVQAGARVDVPTYGSLESWYGLSINSSSNETIAVQESDTAFTITFRRWGHGIGMSQRGAQTMASAHGKTHKAILNFYYPGTSLKTVSLSRAGTASAVKAEGAVIAQADTASTVKMYASADASADLCAEISAGVPLNVHEIGGEWARVSVLGLGGYVSAEKLKGLPETSPSSTAEPTPEPTIEPTSEPTSEPTFTAEPTAESTAAPAPTFPVIETAAPTAVPSAVPTARPTPTAEPLPTVLDQPMPTPIPGPAGTEGMLMVPGTLYAYVRVSTGSTLTLRSAPSASAEPLAYLSNGARVRLLAFDDSWACVRTAAGVTGFAARRYLYLAGSSSSESHSASKPQATPRPQATARPDQGFSGFREVQTGVTFCSIAAKTKQKVKVYKSYSTSSAVLGSLPASARVTVTAYNKTWAYIKLGGRRGFVQIKYLKAQ